MNTFKVGEWVIADGKNIGMVRAWCVFTNLPMYQITYYGRHSSFHSHAYYDPEDLQLISALNPLERTILGIPEEALNVHQTN